jgi:hypothetical protein
MFDPAKRYHGYKDRPMLLQRVDQKIFYSGDGYIPYPYVFTSLPYPVTLVYLRSFDIAAGIALVEIDHADTFNYKHFNIYLSWNDQFLSCMQILELKRYNGHTL